MSEDRRIRRSRALIREAMLECLKTTSLDKVTVKQICEMADINRSTFYAHYDDPLALYRQMEAEMLAQMDTAVAQYQNQAMPYDQLLVQLLQCFSANSELFLALMSSGSQSFYEKNISLMERYDQKLINIAPQENRSLATAYYVGGLLSVISTWIRQGKRQSVDEMAALIFRLTRNRLS